MGSHPGSQGCLALSAAGSGVTLSISPLPLKNCAHDPLPHFRQELVPGLGPASCFGGPGIPTSLPQGGSSCWGWDGGCRGEAYCFGPASPKTLQSKQAVPEVLPPPTSLAVQLEVWGVSTPGLTRTVFEGPEAQ